MGKQDWKRSWKPWLRGTAGFPFGAAGWWCRAAGTFLSYITEKKLPKHPEEFGKGAIEGVAGPEAATTPRRRASGADAVTGPADQRHCFAGDADGVRVSRYSARADAVRQEPLLIWTLIASRFIGNFMLLALNLPLAPCGPSCCVLRGPTCTRAFCSSPPWVRSRSTCSRWTRTLLLVFVDGLMMRRFRSAGAAVDHRRHSGTAYRAAALRQSLQLGGGDWMTLFREPVAIGAYVLMAILLLAPLVLRLMHRDGETLLIVGTIRT